MKNVASGENGRKKQIILIIIMKIRNRNNKEKNKRYKNTEIARLGKMIKMYCK